MKNKKSIFLIKIIILFLIISKILTTRYANGNCKIKDGPSAELTKYVSNLHKEIEKISDKVSSSDEKQSTLNEIKAKLISFWNSISGWDGYFSYFEFYIIYGLKEQYIKEVRRDYNILKKEFDGLKRYKNYVVRSGKYDHVKDDLNKIIKTHAKVMDAFRLTIINNRNNFSIKDVIDLKDYVDTQDCKEDKKFTDRIREIVNSSLDWNNATQNWIDAWSLLNGSYDTKKYSELERQLLKEELSRQGVGQKGAQAILKNLDNYNNNGGFSKENNFLTNSFNYLKKSLENSIDPLSKGLKEIVDEWEKRKKNTDKTGFPAFEYSNIIEENKKEIDIQNRLKNMKNELEILTQNQNEVNSNYIGNLIEIHKNLELSIEILRKAQKARVRVCNSQAQGLGNCEVE